MEEYREIVLALSDKPIKYAQYGLCRYLEPKDTNDKYDMILKIKKGSNIEITYKNNQTNNNLMPNVLLFKIDNKYIIINNNHNRFKIEDLCECLIDRSKGEEIINIRRQGLEIN